MDIAKEYNCVGTKENDKFSIQLLNWLIIYISGKSNLQGITKFWEILKNGWIWIFTILIYLDAPVDVLKALEILAPKTLLLSRKIDNKDLPVLPVNFIKFQIAPTAIQW